MGAVKNLIKTLIISLKEALSWNVKKQPEKRNLLGWTFIVTRITLLPRSVSLRVKIVNFDTEHLVSISICWLAFLIQIALPGDENVNIRQSQTSNCRCQTSLQNSIQNCSIFYLPYRDWHKVSDLFGLWMWTLDQVCYCCPFQVWNRQGTQDILGNNFNKCLLLYIPSRPLFQIFKNSSDSRVSKRPNMCYLFEKRGMQGYQIWHLKKIIWSSGVPSFISRVSPNRPKKSPFPAGWLEALLPISDSLIGCGPKITYHRTNSFVSLSISFSLDMVKTIQSGINDKSNIYYSWKGVFP